MATHQINGWTIHTSNVLPPIPDRRFDWSATEDNYDGAEDSSNRYQIGYGRTEQEAIDDLLDQLNDDNELAQQTAE